MGKLKILSSLEVITSFQPLQVTSITSGSKSALLVRKPRRLFNWRASRALQMQRNSSAKPLREAESSRTFGWPIQPSQALQARLSSAVKRKVWQLLLLGQLRRYASRLASEINGVDRAFG